MPWQAPEFSEKLAGRIEKYLQLLDSAQEPDPRRRLEEHANLHADIARLYDQAGLPWAIPHYREALSCREQIRAMVRDVTMRMSMLDRIAELIYYPLFFAYLRELERSPDWQPPPHPVADLRWQREFAQPEAPDGLAQLRRGNALIYAFHVLEAARARTFVDRLEVRHSGGRLEAPSLEKMAGILVPPAARAPAALITWLCAGQETHVFRLMSHGPLDYIRVPIPEDRIGDAVQQIWDDHHTRSFNVVRPNTERKPHWQLLQDLSPLITAVVQDLEPGTPLVLEPHQAIARLPLGLLPVGDRFLIERHPLSVVSCHAHLMTARRRNVERRIKREADATDRILAVGTGRSEAERERCDFDPLRDWADPETAPPGLISEPLLWEQATVPALAARLPGHRFCALTCHGHYQYLDVEDSGLLLWGGQKLDLQALAGLELDLDLVFCNTCVSGQSRTRFADEPFGVPMSCALAGAPCVVGSLWDVWYEAGRRTLRSFFRFRRQDDRQVEAAVALQRAVLSTREMFPDPFHWGGWLLYGDWI